MLAYIKAKIIPIQDIHRRAAQWRFLSQRIVFTNGCFDILHYGHIHYLAEAKALGDILIVGLNSAASIKRLKGEHRPIQDDLTRQYQLAAMVAVDAVVEFDDDTPLELIKIIQPDVLVKGGDWQPEQIVGSDVVLARRGIVKSLPYVENYSTTNIEQHILRQHQK
ncbi:MAG: D-glycero-beta-D-manno-heptose 1-phosphate adenylyltransferase [Saprospiraceae bacterium]|nr:D-glycero-beta-D-manno-heptose 1-phosphate adenylyltransferase [Saprospiraceae bacterium]MBP7680188.1 D-glycero-beta-D-manno-heptose 1-phosphate adenylyltransferase [Saprospiraceae bacterium]